MIEEGKNLNGFLMGVMDRINSDATRGHKLQTTFASHVYKPSADLHWVIYFIGTRVDTNKGDGYIVRSLPFYPSIFALLEMR